MRVEAIHKICQQKMAVAINQTASEANAIIDSSFGVFYGGGSPTVYQRTGTLPGSSDVKSPVIAGDTVSLDAGYDGSKISYNTGTPGFPVFEATATGTAGVVGNPSYDDMALQQIIAAAEAAFSAQFG